MITVYVLSLSSLPDRAGIYLSPQIECICTNIFPLSDCTICSLITDFMDHFHKRGSKVILLHCIDNAELEKKQSEKMNSPIRTYRL